MKPPFMFTIPAGLNRVDEILALAERIRTYGKNIQLQAYDQVQGMQWNGGRLVFNSTYMDPDSSAASRPTDSDLPEVVRRVRRLNDAGIGFNFAFNSTMESMDLDDEDGNYLLGQIHNEMNGVTIATESLRRHVTTQFPKLERTASICFTYMKVEQYSRACSLYDKVVVMPAFAYLPELLSTLPVEKLVFIVNDNCYLHCPRKDHYDYISRCSLSGHNSRIQQSFNAPRGHCLLEEPLYREKVKRELNRPFVDRINRIQKEQLAADGLGPEDMEHNFTITPAARRELIRIGVSTFKLQGRENNNEMFQTKVSDFLEKIVREEL